jgi:hypothetical protein
LGIILSGREADRIVTRLGPLIGALGRDVSREIVAQYTALLSSPNPDIQYAVAFSFPAVANAVGAVRFSEELLCSFQDCCAASDIRVRRTIAFGLAAFAPVVERADLTDAAFDLVRDIPEVSIGAISHLSEILPFVDDHEAFVVCFLAPRARFVSWRMRLILSEQIRKCARFFDHQAMLDCACELVEDSVAAVRSDAVLSLGEILLESDLGIAEDLEVSVNHWARLSAVRILQVVRPAVAVRGREIARRLMKDRVPAVRVAAEIAWRRTASAQSEIP